MWRDITFTCGHTDKVQIYGKRKDADWRIEQLKTSVCPACQLKLNLEIAQEDVASGLCPLIGSDKQIAYASAIRRRKLAQFHEKINSTFESAKKIIDSGGEKAKKTIADWDEAKKRSDMLIWMLEKKQNSAKWWIERDSYPINLIVAEIGKMIVNNEKTDEISSIRVAAQAEATVKPENQKHDIVVEIALIDDCVTVKAPKDEDLRLLMRTMGLEFDRECFYWKKKITETTGSAQDRAADIGNTLLNEGFIIRVYDEDIRQKAIAADFDPECKRWIKFITKGEYSDWLAISWERGNQEIYDAARRINGSRWSSPYIVVPIDRYQMVEDFADALGFKLTKKASRAIDEYKRHEASSIIPVKPTKPDLEDKLGKILESSREVLGDLRDD